MARIKNESPLRRLKSKVATIAQLRAMSPHERDRATCTVCEITYTSSTNAQACRRWHLGQGT